MPASILEKANISGALAQLGARLTGSQKVRGSSPLCSTKTIRPTIAAKAAESQADFSLETPKSEAIGVRLERETEYRRLQRKQQSRRRIFR